MLYPCTYTRLLAGPLFFFFFFFLVVQYSDRTSNKVRLRLRKGRGIHDPQREMKTGSTPPQGNALCTQRVATVWGCKLVKEIIDSYRASQASVLAIFVIISAPYPLKPRAL
jgi:hypothetical protein